MNPSQNLESSAEQASNSFGRELASLFTALEQLSKDTKLKADSQSIDRISWGNAISSVACLLLAWACTALIKRPEIQADYRWITVILCAFLLLGGVGMFLEFSAFGFTKPAYWREVRELFSKRDNYPFEPLSRCLQNDLAALDRLSAFSARILAAGVERIAAEEADLRERLTSLLGTPSVAMVAGLIASVASGWQALISGPSALSSFVFVSSIGITFLSGVGMRLRMLLTELTRCRALLALELARRKHLEA